MLVFLFLLESESWYKPEWFFPSTWQSYVWQNSFWLYAIPFIILLPLLRWLLVIPFRQKVPVVLPKNTKPFQRRVWLRFVPDIILLFSLALVMIALARPQRVNEKTEKYSEGIDIVIVIDVSESMLYEDYSPNRLQTALQTAQKFIGGRLYEDRIGLVVFAGEAFTLVPLTTDYDLLRSYLQEEVKAQMTETDGTALGDALAVAINRLEQSKAKSKVVILISDGDSNAGKIQPLEAVRLAQEKQIKVYSIIAASRQEQVPYGKDALGKPVMYENAIDEQTMRQIAQISKGEFFRAENPDALNLIFEKISAYEKSEILEVKYVQAKDYYRIYLIWGVLFWLVWLALKTTFMNNALED